MEKVVSEVQNKFLYIVGAVLIAYLLFVCVACPLLAPHDPVKVNMSASLKAPCAEYPFGTDRLGRCILSRIMEGGKYSLLATCAVVIVTMTGGSLLGMLAAYYGGKLDWLILRITDVFLAFPSLVLSVAIAGMAGGSLMVACIAILVTRWTKFARLAHSLTIIEKQKDYVAAGILSGASRMCIVFVYILPNIISQLLVLAMTDIGMVLLAISGMSFLGLGSQPPSPEWGAMLCDGKSMIQTAPWLTVFPGAVIFITVCLFNFAGDKVRDILDPKENSGNKNHIL